MSTGRVVGACLASVAVAGCATVVLNMGRAAERPAPPAAARPAGEISTAVRPVVLPMTPAAGVPVAMASSTATTAALPTTSVAVAPTSATPTSATPSATPTSHAAAPRPTSAAAPRPSPAAPRTSARTTSSAAPRPAPTRSTAAATPTLVRGQALPLRFRTYTATRVITVTAPSTSSTTARLQAWTKAPGGGWLRYGDAVTAHVGADGLSTHPSEWRSATPIGTFTLTLAFGHDANPGTSLPYIHTTPADWWISQAGPLYNTHQRCWSGCPFTQGNPNEHLYYETPYYDYAVVIDYNTRNSPTGVVQGAGSAFFLHVTDGTPTAGCVAIPQWKLIRLMRWLTPAAHPRILIGVT